MCVSPGTMAQFSFYRRDGDEEGRRPHLNSITEDDVTRDIDYVMDQMEIEDEAVAVPVRELAAKSKSELEKAKSICEVLGQLSEVQDMIESDYVLRPLLHGTKFKSRIRERRIPESTTFSFLKRLRKREEESWFIPVTVHMRQYAKSQPYCFDFPDPPVRFALNAKVKGSV